MDERWELAVADGAFWIDDGPSKKLDLLITDGVECGNIYVTPDEACRIALELLRRVGRLEYLTVRELGAVFDRATVSELRARHTPATPTG